MRNPRNSHYSTADVRQLAKLIGSAERVAMLTTLAPGGALESRPMRVVDLDADGVLWFYIEHRPQDAAARERHRRVNLSFADESSCTFVSVPGRGSIVHDPDLKHGLWSPELKDWFPDGPGSARLALLKVAPETASYWDGPDCRLVRGLELTFGEGAERVQAHGALSRVQTNGARGDAT